MDLVDAQDAAAEWLVDGEVAVPEDHLWRYRRNVSRLHPPPVDPVFKAALQETLEKNQEMLERLAAM